jgi:ATP-dependent Clp protease protease subunit
MKYISILLLTFCLSIGTASAFNPDDGIDRSMEVPYSDPMAFSALTKVIGDTAYVSVYSELSQKDEIAIYNDMQILLISPEVTKIKVYLNSGGGGAYAGFAIGDQFRRIKDKFDISVHASGFVGSAAVMVFAAFENRFAAPNTMFMVHEVATPSTAGMNRTDVKNMEEIFGQLTDRYVSILVGVSNKCKEDWDKLLEEETYFFADEAVEWGLVTEVR